MTTETLEKTRWQISVDRAACTGTGMCVHAAPAYFRLVEGRAEALCGTADADAGLLDAALNCPVEAIRLTEVATGTVIAPEL
ncbi:ferredoxin [Streptomyces lavendulae]|uniref:ferredoxin n=1 Tax=Streptomyces TaxID=1883 RepID=UPI002255F5F9|nr:ferredoxin [Streptomyces sp. SPB4]MDH6543440.1 ferredoxin [Streptomyces sp. SPB4]